MDVIEQYEGPMLLSGSTFVIFNNNGDTYICNTLD